MIEARRVWTVRPSVEREEEEVADHHAGGLALVYGGSARDGETRAVSRARLGGERARGPLHHHLVASEALDLQGVLTLTPATSTSRGGFASAAANLTT